MTPLRFFLFCASFIAGLFASTLFDDVPAQAALWVAGAKCAPAESDAVRPALRGYNVRVRPGSHPMLPMTREWVSGFVLASESRVLPSGDGRAHVCLNGAGFVFALYVPSIHGAKLEPRPGQRSRT